MNKLLLGSDPEIFAIRDGIIIPPICVEEEGLERIGTLVPNDPDYHPVYYRDDNIQIIGDGAAFEFNVPPCRNSNEMDYFWSVAKNTLREIIPSDLTLSAKAAEKFDLNLLLEEYNIPEKRLSYSTRFGCDAQYNIYENSSPTPEVDAKEIKWRYAGGHIHISPVEHQLLRPIIYGLDQTVGVYCLFNSPYPNEEKIRQEFYGVPGNYRPQMYGNISGLEYRTPSVAWLESRKTINAIFDLIPYVLSLVESDALVPLFAEFNEKAQEAILSYNKELGEEVMRGMHIIF